MRFSFCFSSLMLACGWCAGVVLAAPDALEPIAQSSRLTSLVISEIMYHPIDRIDGKRLEFIELHNSAGTPQAIGGYSLDGDVAFRFAPGTTIAAGGTLVIARVPADIESVYGLQAVQGPFNNNLPNDDGVVRLRNRRGAILLQVEYETMHPWPVAPDGAGPSLVLARPSIGEADPRAWIASRVIGGTPGRIETFSHTTLQNVVLNEIVRDEYIELFNRGPEPVDLSGCVLTDDPLRDRIIFPPGTVISGGGFHIVENEALTFSIDPSGETLLWKAPSGEILDALRVGVTEPGIPVGRSPNGAGETYRLAERSPASSNSAVRVSDVVINEIMYHPISRTDDDQYVELHNQGIGSMDVSGWSLQDGIRFVFPPNTIIPGGGYLVVAKNAARLRTNYSALTAQNTVGNFAGTLSHRGERVALASGNGVIVDEVTYADGGGWGRWSDGGGSSLEKIDPHANGRFAANWMDSNETAKAGWTVVTLTGRLDNGNVDADSLQVLLQGPGECLIDDVEVLDAAGINVVANSSFESGVSTWVAEGTEFESGWQRAEGYESARSYHVRAVARGDNQINRIRAALTSVLEPNSIATIRAKVRWLKGHPEVLFRLRGNWLDTMGEMELPLNLGSPGVRNSRSVANAGPAIGHIQHFPVLPKAGEPVKVSAHVSDPDGVEQVLLQYRIDPSSETTALLFRDDGLMGDRAAQDGVFTATIPGQVAGTLVAFRVLAQDMQSVSASHPVESDFECLIRFGESSPSGNLPIYRIWMTQDTHNEWTSRHKLNNTPLKVTFVLGGNRVIYNATALYAGSPYIAPGYISPTEGKCGYSIEFPSDDRFLGSTDLVLDWPGGHGGERTAIQEQMGYWLAEQADLPYCHRYHIRLHVNGVTDVQRRTIFEAVNQPNGEFLEAWSPSDSDGDFYKIDRAFEFTDTGGLSADPQPRLRNYTTLGGAKKVERYRWTFLKRAAERADDYSNIFELVDALNASSPEPYTSATESLVDIEQWMGIFALEHIIANFDAYGHQIGKNMYAYKPESRKWQLYMFDLDWLMIAAARLGPTYLASSAPLYNADDPTIVRMYNHPPFHRAYLRTVQRVVDGPLRSEMCDPVMDAKYQSLVANGVNWCDGQTLTDPTLVKTWFSERRAFLVNHLQEVAATFAVGTEDFRTNSATATIHGTAPVSIKGLRLNGRDVKVTWTTVTNWSLSVGLDPGINTLTVDGYDSADVVIASDEIVVRSNEGPELTVAATLTAQGTVRLVWNSKPGAEYRVESRDDVAESEWTPIQTITAEGATISIDLSLAAPRRFYRIAALP